MQSCGDEGKLKKKISEMVIKYAPEMGAKTRPESEVLSSVSTPLFREYRFLNDSVESLLEEIGTSDAKRESPEDLVFSSGILEEMERQCEEIVKEVGDLVRKREEKRKEGAEGEPTVEGVLRTLEMLLLDLEKIQVQVGTESLEDCRDILSRLHRIRDSVEKGASRDRGRRRDFRTLLAMTAVAVLAVLYKRHGDYLWSLLNRMLS